MDCIWTSSKAEVTIKYVAACDFKNQTTFDNTSVVFYGSQNHTLFDKNLK